MITNEMKAKAFGLYIGCEYKRYGSSQTKLNELVEKVNGYTIQLILEGEKGDVNYQLILKPLSEITDEDKKALSGLFEMGEYADYTEQLLSELSNNYGGEWAISANDALKTVDFLRSKGYALPAFGIDLFESSLAIPKQ